MGVLWEKLWHREKPTQLQVGETAQQKKQRLKQSRQLKRKRPIEEKESYRRVEAFQQVDEHFFQKETSLKGQPKVIHVFDREGDISEVFEQACQIKNTGVVVRAAHNRSLQESNQHLWEYVAAQRVQFVLEVPLPETIREKLR